MPHSAGAGGRHGARRSKQATVIGRAAEKLFYDFLLASAPAELQSKIRWLANEGLTPGYDIQDERDPTAVTAYEVKGTTGTEFRSIEITANELECAQRMGEQYAIVLLSGVGSPSPKFQTVRNPDRWLAQKAAVVVPTVFSMTFAADAIE